ncbi:MAG: carboxylesterase family protein [Phenylobacterium sp.]|uniref:carboxylesterase/lipase family protein n=1 Tax=Phenylobacterium sp. TaxID=1871053 RepID=UPI002732790B|nr:carboxylesterase family protein [Phenylobacterium sp.]MDP3745723.1 carboxylesterase family protein [Phenylobacterium sp.]
MRFLGVALALSLGLAGCAQAAPRPPLAGEPTRAAANSGPLEGRSAGGVAAFLGVPYAAPPVGDLRWRPPQPAPGWTAPRDASRFGSDCLQHPLPTFIDPGSGQPRSEDCLYLNVWAPAKAKGRPVMVWIHGGGFTIGSGAMAVSDGAALSRQGVVVVTLNYRLGRFGFFAHPALARPGEPTGNYAIMDQIAALQWVKRNIAAFGGDPTNVTVFGESAGGGSVLALMGSPAARGLFHKAIVESGGGRDEMASLETPSADAPAGHAAGMAFAEKAGLKAPDAAALRALPAEKVLGDLAFFNNRNRDDYAGLMIDGQVVTGDPAAIFAWGEQAPVPLIIGFNSAELAGAKAVTGGWAKQAAARFGPAEAGLRKIYDPDGGDGGLASNFLSDLVFVEPARFLARAHARAGHPIFLYQFDYVAEAKRATTPGAGHATEIAYVFDAVGQVDPKASAQDRAMSAVVSRYWTAFAGHGDPNGAGLPSWPAYQSKADTLLNFTAAGAAPLAGRSAARLDYIEVSWPKP